MNGSARVPPALALALTAPRCSRCCLTVIDVPAETPLISLTYDHFLASKRDPYGLWPGVEGIAKRYIPKEGGHGGNDMMHRRYAALRKQAAIFGKVEAQRISTIGPGNDFSRQQDLKLLDPVYTTLLTYASR